MSQQGSVTVTVFTSDARLPIYNAFVTITSADGTVLQESRTNRSGQTRSLPVDTPDREESQSPGSNAPPFTALKIVVRHPSYATGTINGVQVFPQVATEQLFRLIPMLPDVAYEFPPINISPQDL